MKVERETWIDYARGIAIILVLYRHVFEGIKNSGISINGYIFLEHFNIMFFSFRMPLFFIISGIFIVASLNKRGVVSFISTKARTILYPYFLWGILQISLQILFSDYVNKPPGVKDFIYLLYLPREIEQFWYLYALFNISVLYMLVKVKFKVTTSQNIGIGLILFYISSKLHQQSIHIWFLGDIIHYYLFYAIGDGICRFITNQYYQKFLESGKVLIIMLVPFIITQLYFLKANLNYADHKYEFVEFFYPLYFLIIALCGCAFVINLSFVLQKNNIASWLHRLGSYSLYIYVAHVIVLAATRAMMTKVFSIYNVPVLLICGIITGLLIPIILYKLASKLNMKWLFSLEKKRTILPEVNA
ncbi:MAG: acyltransferase [Ferruginibacter sp.]